MLLNVPDQNRQVVPISVLEAQIKKSMKVEIKNRKEDPSSLPAKWDSRGSFKVKEICEITGLHRSSIDRLIERQELKASVKLRHKLVSRAELERFLNQ